MSKGEEAPKLALKKTEQLATERAREKIRTARWDLSVAVVAYAILGAVILLRFEGMAIEIVAPVAVFGLGLVWLMGWRRGKQLFKRFYNEELRSLQEFGGGKTDEISLPSPLSPRETEILNHIAGGLSNKGIAAKLGISEQTIKNHMSSILSKLEANDRTQAVVMGIHSGWISSRMIESSELATGDKDKASIRL